MFVHSTTAGVSDSEIAPTTELTDRIEGRCQAPIDQKRMMPAASIDDPRVHAPASRSARQHLRVCRPASSHELFDAGRGAGRLQPHEEERRSEVAPDQLVWIDKLPAAKLDTLKMAVRFMVGPPPRSIGPVMTEGLGPSGTSAA